MAHEPFDEAVALYALDALETDERQAFETHLAKGCEECQAALKEYRAVAGLLPYALSPVEVPFQLKSHLMRTFALDTGVGGMAASTARSSEHTQRRWLSNWQSLLTAPALAFASILLLVGVSVYALTIRYQLQGEGTQRRQLEAALQTEVGRLTALQSQTAEQEKRLAGLRRDLAEKLGSTRDTLAAREQDLAELRVRMAQEEQEVTNLTAALSKRDEMAALLRSSNIKVVSLAGSDDAKAAGALVLFDPTSRKGLLYAFNMPALPAGKTYQLWAIVDKPVSAGTFVTDAGNKSRLLIKRVPDPAHVKKFAISLEPEGGQPQPTGPVYLSGQL